jgi:hypothetical protein
VVVQEVIGNKGVQIGLYAKLNKAEAIDNVVQLLMVGVLVVILLFVLWRFCHEG